jgi:hypothetical protein
MEFEVLTVINIESMVLWEVTPSSLGTGTWGKPAPSIFWVDSINFCPADGNCRFLQDIGTCLPNYMASHPRRP